MVINIRKDGSNAIAGAVVKQEAVPELYAMLKHRKENR